MLKKLIRSTENICSPWKKSFSKDLDPGEIKEINIVQPDYRVIVCY